MAGIVMAAGIVAGTSVAPASAARDDASAFVRTINAERAAAGRGPLRVHPELVAYAIRHARAMAASDSIWHSRGLSRKIAVGTVVGENVGYGADVDHVHSMFMGSPRHRSNVLDGDYQLVGVGVVEKHGWIYVAEIFAGSPSRSRATVAAAPIAAAPLPDTLRAMGAAHQTGILRQLQHLDASVAMLASAGPDTPRRLLTP